MSWYNKPDPTWPELPQVPSATRMKFRSENSDRRTNVEFVNTRSEQVFVYWINYKGRRVPYGELGPGERFVMYTFVTHPWVVCDSADRELGCYLPTARPARVIVR